MKKIILSVALLVIFWGLYAQEGDTTKLRIGDTKIIIIDKNKDENSQFEKKEEARQAFEKMLLEKTTEIELEQQNIEKLQQEIENHQNKLNSLTDEALRKKEEHSMQQLEKEMAQSEKKLQEIEKEIAAIEKGLDNLNDAVDDFEKEDDEEWSKDKFDWQFEKDWPKNWDNMSPFGRKKKFRGHWAGFEVGLNNYVNAEHQFTFGDDLVGFELDGGRSWVFSLNFMELNLPFGRYAGITTGLGTSWNNYAFRNNVNFLKNEAGSMVATNEAVRSYNRNSIHTWNFTIPFILEIQIPSGGKSSGIYMGFGAYGTAKVSSWGNLEYQLDGVKYQERRKSDFLMNNLRYGLTARLGLKYIRLFANYDMVPLFQKDRGPELFPVSIGLMLLSF
jgi:hypothetical protein